MEKEYINHIKSDFIDERHHLIAEKGYVMTDGKELYSRYLILEVGAMKPSLTVITDEEYQRILDEKAETDEIAPIPKVKEVG
jgi:hypothetical protein